MEGTGIVPVMDMNNNRNNGYGDSWGMGGAWFVWIIVIFALLGGWGNNWNRGNGYGLDAAAVFANGSMTRDQVADGFSQQEIKNGIRGIQNGLCDGFYAQNTTMLQGFNGIQRDLCQGFSGIGAAVAENRFAAQQCCCETNRNIDSLRFQTEKNTCDITTAIHQEGEQTRALITANTMQDLRDKLADRDRDLQTANFQLSQQAQSANLISALRPFPQPAYITCSPYEAAHGYAYGRSGCGYDGCCNA